MKLEVVDCRNLVLICVVSVEDVEDYWIKIYFDGWSYGYDFWIDVDYLDIYFVGWCFKIGYFL